VHLNLAGIERDHTTCGRIAAAGVLKDVPDKIEWKEFPAATPLLEALSVGAIETGLPDQTKAQRCRYRRPFILQCHRQRHWSLGLRALLPDGKIKRINRSNRARQPRLLRDWSFILSRGILREGCYLKSADKEIL
jgi:hypothetical protein